MTGKLLTRLFALFGMTLTCVACYGVEYSEFHPEFGATGRVVDEQEQPIKGIKARCGGVETETDEDGRFYVRNTTPYIVLTDVDGEANGGDFQEKYITLESDNSNIDLGNIKLERK